MPPPIQPDDPSKCKPSDHWVPVCAPHTDRYNPPVRTFRTIKYRPLPESKLRLFGEWIVTEGWEGMQTNLSPSEQTEVFETIIQDKLNTFCPEKCFRLSSQDKAWMTAELKVIHRQKMREYERRGKSDKYKALAEKFESKYKCEAEKYLRKNLDELMESKPGQAYAILKRMGAQPGDCVDTNTFTLPQHEAEGLTAEQSAERIASYFAHISQEFPPLDHKLLPPCVQSKLRHVSKPPVISEYETYQKIMAANKPKAGIPGDLPRTIVQEFSPELATPVGMIINNIFQSGQWPDQWKMEWITAIGKVPIPESEDDLRPISLTAFFSKVAEHFVVEWLLKFIQDKIDFRQYGGMKGNSITHYLIEFINFILLNQDSTEQTAILAFMVDFSKAFNRQNHNLLITKLSDMGVPSWLLKVVMGFLTNRKMTLRYRGKHSNIKYLPGGGPQGTLLGLLLFVVLINDAGFEGQQNNAGELLTSRRNMRTANEIHLKYVDDLTLAEAINLPDNLVHLSSSERPLPDNYHARTGHVLRENTCALQKQLVRTKEYAENNQMKVNKKKSKVMLFNPCTSIDFMPRIELDNTELELVEQMKLLGVVIQSDMKWTANTEYIVKRAYKKLWVIRRLKGLGAETSELVDMYIKQVRSVLEFAVPAWQGAITLDNKADIERVQKCALHIIHGSQYEDYKTALKNSNLEPLETRREKLCLKFAKKAEKDVKHNKWFKPKPKLATRQPQDKYFKTIARTGRLMDSPISYLTNLLNHNA